MLVLLLLVLTAFHLSNVLSNFAIAKTNADNLLASLLCATIPLGLINGLLHVLNVQTLCLLGTILLDGNVHTNSDPTHYLCGPPIRKVFYWFHIVCVSITVDVNKPMCIRASLRRIILIGSILYICLATCHLWLLVLIMILKVREHVMNNVYHCQMMFFNLTLLDKIEPNDEDAQMYQATETYSSSNNSGTIKKTANLVLFLEVSSNYAAQSTLSISEKLNMRYTCTSNILHTLNTDESSLDWWKLECKQMLSPFGLSMHVSVCVSARACNKCTVRKDIQHRRALHQKFLKVRGQQPNLPCKKLE